MPNYVKVYLQDGVNVLTGEKIVLKNACHNCVHCRRQKGAFLGTIEFWCSVTNRKKRELHVCDLYKGEYQRK